MHGGDAATNTSIEGPEVEKWRCAFTKTQALLAAANAKLGSNVTIGCAQFDVESFSWSPNYQGDAVRANASFWPYRLKVVCFCEGKSDWITEASADYRRHPS